MHDAFPEAGDALLVAPRKVIATPALAAAERGTLTAQLEELFGLLTGEIRPNR